MVNEESHVLSDQSSEIKMLNQTNGFDNIDLVDIFDDGCPYTPVDLSTT